MLITHHELTIYFYQDGFNMFVIDNIKYSHIIRNKLYKILLKFGSILTIFLILIKNFHFTFKLRNPFDNVIVSCFLFLFFVFLKNIFTVWYPFLIFRFQNLINVSKTLAKIKKPWEIVSYRSHTCLYLLLA